MYAFPRRAWERGVEAVFVGWAKELQRRAQRDGDAMTTVRLPGMFLAGIQRF